MDYIGKTFGSLTVVEQIDDFGKTWSKKGYTVLRCECTSGHECIERVSEVIHRKGTICCCFRKTSEQSRTSKLPEYGCWGAMKQRCLNPVCSHYQDYGGRGITVCQRWLDFDNFLVDMGPRPSLQHSLDRIDVNGNYEPGNCRWATKSEQCKNRRKRLVLQNFGNEELINELLRRCSLKVA